MRGPSRHRANAAPGRLVPARTTARDTDRKNRMTRSTQTRARTWIVPGLLVTICSVLSFFGAALHDRLDFTREGIAAGRLWPLVTGHAMHLDASHAALNLVALVLVALTFSRDLASPAAQFLVLGCGVFAIDAGLWFGHPEVGRYVGLSGLLHAWFAAGVSLWIACAFDGPRDRPRDRPPDRARAYWGALLMVMLAVKLVVEARGAAFWHADLALPVVTAAHRWGTLGGIVAGATLAWWYRRARA